MFTRLTSISLSALLTVGAFGNCLLHCELAGYLHHRSSDATHPSCCETSASEGSADISQSLSLFPPASQSDPRCFQNLKAMDGVCSHEEPIAVNSQTTGGENIAPASFHANAALASGDCLFLPSFAHGAQPNRPPRFILASCLRI